MTKSNISNILGALFTICVVNATGNLYATDQEVNDVLTYYDALQLQVNDGVVEIPEGVETIDAQAFQNNANIKIVKLPSTVKYINQYAFYGCQNLQKVEVSKENDNEIDVGPYAFASCPELTTINMNNVREIGDYAFYGCVKLKFESKDFLPKAQKVGPYSFSYCHSLTEVQLPESISSNIGDGAFSNCMHLEKIYLPGSVSKYVRDDKIFNGQHEQIKKAGIEIIAKKVRGGIRGSW